MDINEGTIFIGVGHDGCNNKTGHLTEKDEKLIAGIALEVKALNIAGLPISIICPSAPEAMQSGKIMAEMLGVPGERTFFSECLWHDGNQKAVREFIEENLQEDSILLGISHLNLAPFIVSHVAKIFGHQEKRFGNPDHGAGWIINSSGLHPFFPL